ncbi:unnamed protein product [Leptosia nina]|uniref:Uncharacterized protein n=1 Tax=Leptosia nina TaxID=320188 RepID=A0AAV1JZ92_9NEOP
MDRTTLFLLLTASQVGARLFCGKAKMPLEIGDWHQGLSHMDSAVVENRPVTINEGQVYVYENYFPGHTINYIHVDNVAIKTCGASASIKKGGIGTSSVLIILHAGTHEEIRSVIDIWGTKHRAVTTAPPLHDLKKLKSFYLFKELRAVNHNNQY